MSIDPGNSDTYDQLCNGNQFCDIQFKLPSAETIDECIAGYQGSRKVAKNQQAYALFFEYQCDIETVNLYYFGPISRQRLANIVIACDAIICLIWVINTMWLGRSISIEQHIVDSKYVSMPDFSVRIKNLPEESFYNKSPEELAAQL